MKHLSCLHYALSGCVVAASLVGCGGSQSPADLAPLGQSGAATGKQTFAYTGSEQTFKVPAGVKRITVTVDGASGAPGYDYGYGNYASPGGLGTRVRATIPVTPRESLAIFVGGDGGFNGGGSGNTYGSNYDGYGGGASDVRQGGDQLADRVVVGAGGGGGGEAGACISTSCGYSSGGAGGHGGTGRGGLGGMARGTRGGSGGRGGRQSAGGAGGAGGAGICGGSSGRQ